LTERGEEEAYGTGLALAEVEWTRCFSSNLGRAKTTCSIITSQSRMDPPPSFSEELLISEKKLGFR